MKFVVTGRTVGLLYWTFALACSAPADPPRTPPATAADETTSNEPRFDVGAPPDVLPLHEVNLLGDISTRRDGIQLSLNSAGRFHEVITTPDGAVFAHHHALWAIEIDTGELTEVHLRYGEEPHGFGTNEKSVFWLSNVGPAELDLATLRRKPAPFIPSAFDYSVSIGDTLYGIGRMAHAWRAAGEMGSVINTGIDPESVIWSGRIRAADRMFALGLLEDDGSSIYRYRIGRRPHRIKTEWTYAAEWDLRPNGTLLFMREDHVFRLDARSNRPAELFERSDTTGLCWCGTNICTFSKSAGELRKHKGITADYTVVAKLEGRLKQFDCSDSHVALIMEGEHSSLHLLSLSTKTRDAAKQK